ncbi:hypothetical protein EG329_012297 [Mollisiaceae sp. DMI_Dod_QoI]|nr:hypothetical protein EG329_012297 [Helotiales sp. DMI_Dod_QoI]
MYVTRPDIGYTYSSFCQRCAGVQGGAQPPNLGDSASWQQLQYSNFFGFKQSDGKMPSSRAKRLVCFYCNKKSDLKYDGKTTQWPCSICEAINYLDENGDITDPPVATDAAATYDLKFTTTRSESPPSQIFESNPFCKTCVKNQHLYTTSLQQYHIEVDPTHPDYRESERLYYKYKKTLEKTYPQVCENCEPRVLERMRAASKTAKSDHLRRLMEKTRARTATATNAYTFFDLVLLLGKWLWYIGLGGQLLWNIMALLAIYGANKPETARLPYLEILFEFLRPLIITTTSRTWARRSLICSIFSIWWNPMFKQLNNGFMNHITGFGEWYKLQLLHIVIRSLFFYTMGSGVFSDLYSPATAGAHLMVPILLSLLAFKSKRALKVDMTPLWNSTPEKLSFVGPRSRSSSQESTGGMAGALDEIAATSSNSLRQPAPLSAGDFHARLSRTRPHQEQTSHLYSTTPTDILQPRNSLPSFRDMPYGNSKNYIATGGMSSHPQYQDVQDTIEEMEWTPSVRQTQARAFNPSRRLQTIPQTSGEPFGSNQPSPFYGRLPEAPISPAHRLRNPPNQARLRVSSQEVKENFFNSVTGRGVDLDQTGNSSERALKHEMNLAQQRFFPPTPPSEAGNVLADLLTSFSLSSPETDTPVVLEEHPARIRHICQALALLLGLFFWTQSANSEKGNTVMLTVLIGCVCIGLRTILDNTVFVRPGKPEAILWHSLDTCIGGFELAAAGYGLIEVLADRSDFENFTSMGTLLIGGMLIHEIWLASFGR